MVITSYFFVGVFDRAISVWPVRSAGSSGPCGPCTLRNNLVNKSAPYPYETLQRHTARQARLTASLALLAHGHGRTEDGDKAEAAAEDRRTGTDTSTPTTKLRICG
eukprot:scaffold9811_cov131-Isochrysis_galbana.AAC.2